MKQDYRQHGASRPLWPVARAMAGARLLQVIWAWL
jgi:hypothetical protein